MNHRKIISILFCSQWVEDIISNRFYCRVQNVGITFLKNDNNNISNSRNNDFILFFLTKKHSRSIQWNWQTKIGKLRTMRKLRFKKVATENMYAIEKTWNFQKKLCNTIYLLEMEEWSPWSNCSCGYQSRNRKCLMDDCFTFKKHENQSCIQPYCTSVTSLYLKKSLCIIYKHWLFITKSPGFGYITLIVEEDI